MCPPPSLLRCQSLSVYSTILPLLTTSSEIPQCFLLTFELSKYTSTVHCLPQVSLRCHHQQQAFPAPPGGPLPSCCRVLQLTIPASAFRLLSASPLADWEPCRKGHMRQIRNCHMDGWEGLLLVWSFILGPSGPECKPEFAIAKILSGLSCDYRTTSSPDDVMWLFS